MSITLATLFILSKKTKNYYKNYFILNFYSVLACLTRNKIAKSINEGIWVLKIIYVIGIFILFLFVSK